MSEKHLKKQAKNAQSLLPDLLNKHPAPYSLSECQELVARLSGYPSWHVALTSQEDKATDHADDPIAAFYKYDWLKATLDPSIQLGNPEKSTLNIHHLLPQDVVAFVRDRYNDPNRRLDDDMIVVNVSGEAGYPAIDEFFNDDDLIEKASGVSLSPLSHRSNATFNPIDGLTPQQIAHVLTAIISAVSSPAQIECAFEAIDLLLSANENVPFDMLMVQAAVDRLICLDIDRGRKVALDDFNELFPDKALHDRADDFLSRYEGKISALLKPLESLLTRFAAPGMDRAFNPTLSETYSDEVLWVRSDATVDFMGLNLIDLNFGNKAINHLVSLFVLARVQYMSQFCRTTTDNTPDAIDIVFITNYI